ncbi:MAG TPA: UDP-N-acetylmuramoyl-L-alanyl-D-glutamate--2,6-diaminopimelate ligase [Acidimicrobiales bacterium]|nr:UDP-N-acetylmuramoyl-L-alanyl-D-glutamate--2,6-diaminopimelate ligase [Acidimicrobiales bacterium]
MRLSRLLGDVEVRSARGDPEGTEIVAIAHNSESVVPGTLFCCVPGARADGHDFARPAVQAGAVALLVERFVDVDVAQVLVDDVRPAMARVAAALFDHPSHRMSVVGITGTNGKTTTAHLLRSVLEADGRRAAVIGTLSGVRTTPAAPELQSHLAELAAEGIEAVAMEVSSHALVQHRVDGVRFAVGVFTNLSQDHLDFHGTMEEYFAAKASLFLPERVAVGVVNADDRWGKRLLEEAAVPMRPFSLAEAVGLEVERTGSTFQWEGEEVRLRLPGTVNVLNALAAAAAARELGIKAAVVAQGLSNLLSVPGRNERVDRGQPFTVLVDYAHSPEALERTLAGARDMAGEGRVLVVFGCGGDRDRAKRPLMGEVATRVADLAVLTNDNPRSEDPAAILDEVRAGVQRTETLVVEPDRRAAIGVALGEARPGDVVVIAGKGHETTQVIGGQSVPFDDRAVAAEILGALCGAGGPEAPRTAGRGPGSAPERSGGAPAASEEDGAGAPPGNETWSQAGRTAGRGAGAPTASEEDGAGAPSGKETWSPS